VCKKVNCKMISIFRGHISVKHSVTSCMVKVVYIFAVAQNTRASDT